MLLGSTLSYAGRVDEAIAHIKQAIRLNPFPSYYYYYHLGRCYMQKGQYEDALTEFKKALQRAPDAGTSMFTLAITYILLDREEEARASAAKALELDPNISVSLVSKISRYKNQAILNMFSTPCARLDFLKSRHQMMDFFRYHRSIFNHKTCDISNKPVDISYENSCDTRFKSQLTKI